ncbi:MAG: DUF308 domain-containing protein [Synergistaceae bacterium]|nr:DUF308 domain-containing protein [Synergistaceae bacterium]
MTPAADFEPGFRKTVRWTLYTDGVIVILMGVLGALYPVLHSPSPSTMMGAGLLVSGLNYLVPCISLKKSPVRPRWFLLIGVLNSLFGVLFLARVGLILLRFPVLAGIWMIFAACARGCMVFENFKAGVARWWITLTVGAYMLFASAAMMTNTSDTVSIPSWSAMIVLGIFIMNEGRKLFGAKKSVPPPQ